MTAEHCTIQDWLRLIQAEYLEMPGLHLTRPQVQRLWRLEPHLCDEVLDALVASKFLKKTHRDAYVLASKGMLSGIRERAEAAAPTSPGASRR